MRRRRHHRRPRIVKVYHIHKQEHQKKSDPFLKILLFVAIIAVIILLIYLNRNLPQEDETNTTQNISIKKIPINKLTEKQVAKAKIMTPEAQIKEFGGIIVDDEIVEEEDKIEIKVDEETEFFDWNELLSDVKGFFGSAKSNITNMLKVEDTCPQIDLPMADSSYLGWHVSHEEFDGWTLHGDATCRKGNREGENINYYYCQVIYY